MKKFAAFFLWLLTGVSVLASLNVQAQSTQSDELGVLIMAHGGLAEWEAGVLETLEPLRDRYTLEVAFGMADAVSLQEAVSKLEARGAKHIAVVRLFISGESWYERTQQILGMIPGAPAKPLPVAVSHDAHQGHGPDAGHGSAGASGGHSMEFWQIDSNARFTMSKQGLAEAPGMAQVLLSRAQDLSGNPPQEDLLILAHGPETDEEDARWIGYIDARAELVRRTLPFHRVKVATLREDWEEKRAGAEEAVKAFVATAAEEGHSAIVIPFRVHGFGPYAKVLEGLDYVADERGLIPHPAVSAWIAAQIEEQRGALQDPASASD